MAPTDTCGTLVFEDSVNEETLDVDIAAVLEEIQTIVFRRRIRFKDSFKDFDSLNSGRCTKRQFVRVLKSVCPTIEAVMLEALADHFTIDGPEVKPPINVCYLRCCQCVDEVFGPSHLEGTPTAKVNLPGSSLAMTDGRFTANHCGDKEARLSHLLFRVSTLARIRGIDFALCCRSRTGMEFPRKSGQVSTEAFLRRFPFLNDFDEDDLKLLVSRYTDRNGFAQMRSFEMDVQRTIEEERKRLEEQAFEHTEEFSQRQTHLLEASDVGIDATVMEAPSDNFRHDSGLAARPKSAFARSAASLGPVNEAFNEKKRPMSASSSLGRLGADHALLPRSCLNEPRPSIDDVFHKILTIIKKRRLRLHDRFADFDGLRKGVCTPGQMRTTLGFLRIELLPAELHLLEEVYRGELHGRALFRYKDFLRDLDAMEEGSSREVSSWGFSTSSKLLGVLDSIRQRARLRRLEILGAFNEYCGKVGKLPRRRVSPNALFRILGGLGFALNDTDLTLLVRAFGDEKGIDYVAFCSAVDPFLAPKAMVQPPTVKPTNVYFDMSGNVVPHRSRPSSAPCGRVMRR